MLVPKNLRRCVAFLFSGQEPVGTAFLVYQPATEDYAAGGALYAVTAAHVVEGARAAGDLRLRINTGSGFKDFPTDPEAWIVASDVDVAATVVPSSPILYLDVDEIPYSFMLTNENVRELEVGEGDEVILSSLFFATPGTKRNLPIVRFGHIALMPNDDDPITVELQDAGYTFFTRRFPAYLMEAHSRGGHSGSPVFLFFPFDREPHKGLVGVQLEGKVGTIGLLGLVSAHYDVELKHQAPDQQNSGIAVVVPAQSIIDLIEETEEFVKHREKLTKQIRANVRPPVAVADKLKETEEQLTRGEFEDALRKATRRVESPKPASRRGRGKH